MIIKQGIKWLWLGVLLLAACSPASGDISGSGAGGGTSLQSEQATVAPSLEAGVQVTEVVSQPETGETLAETTLAETQAPASPVVETKAIATEFQPTDPGTVQLGDGKPKLVEFFAFW